MDTLLKWLDGERGRRKRLADELGLGQPALSQWQQVPQRHLDAVAAFTGLDPALLRPDLAAHFQPRKTRGREKAA